MSSDESTGLIIVLWLGIMSGWWLGERWKEVKRNDR